MWLAALTLWAGASEPCTYTPTAWDRTAGATVPLDPVAKPRDALTAAERGPLGCTPCEQDQVAVTLSNGVTFTACKQAAPRFHAALEQALSEGAIIDTVSGYRPIRSTGPLDATGRRTAWSQHAFGAALDVNADHNGLYEDCARFGPECRLLRGGPYRPGEEPRSWTEDSPLVRAMAEAGFAWGGALAGDQKDFMHFDTP